MARLFLHDRYQTTTGGTGEGTAVLFEMNALFEEYVGRLIARALAGTGLTVSLQGGRLFCLSAQDSQRGLFQTRPRHPNPQGWHGNSCHRYQVEAHIFADR